MADKKTPYNPDAHKFVYNGKTYKVLVPSCIIPGFNKNKPMTALEVVTEASVHEFLVDKAKALGTVVDEIATEPAPEPKPAE